MDRFFIDTDTDKLLAGSNGSRSYIDSERDLLVVEAPDDDGNLSLLPHKHHHRHDLEVHEHEHQHDLPEHGHDLQDHDHPLEEHAHEHEHPQPAATSSPTWLLMGREAGRPRPGRGMSLYWAWDSRTLFASNGKDWGRISSFDSTLRLLKPLARSVEAMLQDQDGIREQLQQLSGETDTRMSAILEQLDQKEKGTGLTGILAGDLRSRPARGSDKLLLYLDTEHGDFYYWNGIMWLQIRTRSGGGGGGGGVTATIDNYIRGTRGLFAARPATAEEGEVYESTDTDELYVWFA